MFAVLRFNCQTLGSVVTEFSVRSQPVFVEMTSFEALFIYTVKL